LKDKKEKWVPVEIPITTSKRGVSKSSKNADNSRNWREDAKGKSVQSVSLDIFIVNSLTYFI